MPKKSETKTQKDSKKPTGKTESSKILSAPVTPPAVESAKPAEVAKAAPAPAPAPKAAEKPTAPAPTPAPKAAEKPTIPAPVPTPAPTPAPKATEKPTTPAPAPTSAPKAAEKPTTPAPAPTPAPKAAEKPTTPAPVPTPAPKTAEKPIAPAKAAKSKSVATESDVTVVVAKYDVGYGNHLYIRGEGAGLNWDAGILMKNVENDVWVWTTNEAAGDTVAFKFLINDEMWSEGDNLVAPAGETTTLYPSFF